MDPFQLLQTAAQLSLGFAGFGGIASGLRQEQKSDDTRVDAGRLINMLTVSLGAMLFALTPCALVLFEMPEQWVWRASALFCIAVTGLLLPGVLSRSKRMRQFAGFDEPTALFNNILTVLALLAFALCVFGVPQNQLPAIYVAGVIAMMMVAAVLFFRVTLSVLRPHAPD